MPSSSGLRSLLALSSAFRALRDGRLQGNDHCRMAIARDAVAEGVDAGAGDRGGAFVPLPASRERLGRLLRVPVAGDARRNGWQFASQWVESFRSQDEAMFFPYTQQPYQQNGNTQHHQELSHTH